MAFRRFGYAASRIRARRSAYGAFGPSRRGGRAPRTGRSFGRVGGRMSFGARNNVFRGQRPVRMIGQGNSNFPQNAVVKLRYSGAIVLLPNAGDRYNWVWRVNGLYDCDITGTGHQPLGYDQLSAIWTTYQVTGCKFKAVCVPVNTPPETMITVGTYITTDTAVASSADAAREQPTWQGKTFASMYTEAGMTAGPITLERYIDMASAVGLKKVLYEANPDNTALVGANPANWVNCNLTAMETTGNASGSVNCLVTLIFYARMWDPVTDTTTD